MCGKVTAVAAEPQKVGAVSRTPHGDVFTTCTCIYCLTSIFLLVTDTRVLFRSSLTDRGWTAPIQRNAAMRSLSLRDTGQYGRSEDDAT